MHSFYGLVHSFLRRCWFISQDLRLFRKIFAFFASYSAIIFDGLALGWYKNYVNGMGMKQIADELNLLGVKNHRGGKIKIDNVNSMLKNRKYLGEYS